MKTLLLLSILVTLCVCELVPLWGRDCDGCGDCDDCGYDKGSKHKAYRGWKKDDEECTTYGPPMKDGKRPRYEKCGGCEASYKHRDEGWADQYWDDSWRSKYGRYDPSYCGGGDCKPKHYGW